MGSFKGTGQMMLTYNSNISGKLKPHIYVQQNRKQGVGHFTWLDMQEGRKMDGRADEIVAIVYNNIYIMDSPSIAHQVIFWSEESNYLSVENKLGMFGASKLMVARNVQDFDSKVKKHEEEVGKDDLKLALVIVTPKSVIQVIRKEKLKSKYLFKRLFFLGDLRNCDDISRQQLQNFVIIWSRLEMLLVPEMKKVSDDLIKSKQSSIYLRKATFPCFFAGPKSSPPVAFTKPLLPPPSPPSPPSPVPVPDQNLLIKDFPHIKKVSKTMMNLINPGSEIMNKTSINPVDNSILSSSTHAQSVMLMGGSDADTSTTNIIKDLQENEGTKDQQKDIKILWPTKTLIVPEILTSLASKTQFVKSEEEGSQPGKHKEYAPIETIISYQPMEDIMSRKYEGEAKEEEEEMDGNEEDNEVVDAEKSFYASDSGARGNQVQQETNAGKQEEQKGENNQQQAISEQQKQDEGEEEEKNEPVEDSSASQNCEDSSFAELEQQVQGIDQEEQQKKSQIQNQNENEVQQHLPSQLNFKPQEENAEEAADLPRNKKLNQSQPEQEQPRRRRKNGGEVKQSYKSLWRRSCLNNQVRKHGYVTSEDVLRMREYREYAQQGKESRVALREDEAGPSFQTLSLMWADPNCSNTSIKSSLREKFRDRIRIEDVGEIESDVMERMLRNPSNQYILVFTNKTFVDFLASSHYPLQNCQHFFIYCMRDEIAFENIARFSPEESTFVTTDPRECEVRLEECIKREYYKINGNQL